LERLENVTPGEANASLAWPTEDRNPLVRHPAVNRPGGHLAELGELPAGEKGLGPALLFGFVRVR